MKTFHMKKMYKKVTAFILAITMIVAYIQIKAYAFDNNVSEITRNQAVSDATIQSGLGVAKNYGLFSLDATSHNDLECSVAAKYADLGADYNFSGNNTKVYKNQLTVSKSFMINNQPQANKNVTLRLYRMDSSQSVLIDVMTQTTDSNGNAKFVFDGMKDSSSNKRYSFIDGDYQVKEVVNEDGVEKEIIPDGSSYIDENGNKIEVNADHSGLIHLESGFQNVSQFGQVKNHSIFKPRNGSIVVLENQDDWNAVDKEAINQGKNNYRNVPAGVTYYNNGEVKIIKAGTNGFQPIAWDQEFDNLKTFSKNLVHAQDSNDVQVYHYNADYLKSVGSLNFDTSKKWAVVNIEVQDGQSTIDITGDYTKNGVKLDADFDNLETGVIWNFYTVNNGDVQPYTGKVTLANQNGGIFLLPAGEFYHNGTIGGKVIAAKYNHDNEIHQKEKVVNVNNYLSMSNNGASEKLEAKQTISGTKKLIGKELQGNDFKFELQKYTDSSYSTPDGEAVVTTNNEKGQFVFSDEDILTYTEPGDYYYIVKEVNDGKNHVQYDSHTFKVSIHVEKQDNALIADDPVVEGGKIEFSNEFKFEGNASLSLVGKKVLNGKKLENDEFTYGLQEYKDSEYSTKEGHEKEVTNDQKGNIQVDLSYDEKDIGKHYYQLKEKNTKKKGIDYDQRIYSIIVDVQYDESKDQLVVSKTITVDGESVDSITFENTYSSNAATTFKGHKILEGRDLNANEFNFVLQETKSDYQTAIGESKTVSNDSQGDFNFGKISYRDLTYGEKQIHYYIIKEVNPVLQGTYQGVSYDQKVYKIKAVVTDQKDGTATVERTVENNDIQFKNTYQAEGSTSLIIHKQLTGGTLKANMFKFKLQQTDENFKKTVGNSQTVTNSSLGQGQFVIHFNQAGTYYYTVSEVNNHKSNVTYDSVVYQIKIKTEDDGQGNIKEVSRSISYVDEMTKPTSEEKENLTFKNAVGIQYDETVYYVEAKAVFEDNQLKVTNTLYDQDGHQLDKNKGIEFENEFKATGKIDLSGHKNFIDQDGQDVAFDAGDFKFKIEELDQDGATLKKDGYSETVENYQDGNYHFKTIHYQKAGTYYYRVSEVRDNLEVTYDITQYIVKVDVKANDSKQFDISVDIVNGQNEHIDQDKLNFTNRLFEYKVALLSMGGIKTVSAGQSVIMDDGLFRFGLYEGNDNEQSNMIDTAKNDTVGAYSFDDVEIDQPGTYHYTIEEMNAGKEVAGIAYTNHQYHVEAVVNKDGKGGLNVDSVKVTNENNQVVKDQSVVVETSQDLSLTNQAVKSLKVNKVWNDQGHSDTIQPVTVHLVKNGKVVEGQSIVLSNDNQWSGSFDNLPIKDSQGNLNVYTVKEDKVDYYKTQYIQNEDGSITITNTYINPTAVDVQLVAKKNLVGGKVLSAGMYQFDLLDGNNEVVETQTNDDQGNIYFNTLNFNQEGHYVYYIQEHVNDNDPFVEYDQSIYQVNIDVSRNGNNLQAEVEYLLDDKQVDDVTFNNIYHPLSLTVQKRSKDLSKDPLEGAVYGLYKVNEKGTDILIEKQTSNSEGYMTFMKAVPEYQYYFKEISAPNGHTVDEYKTKTFTIKWIRHKNGKISYQLIYDGQKEDLEEEKQEDSLNLYAQQSIALLENEDTSVNLEAIGVADEVTKLNVTKVDNQGNYLTGAHLQILEKETGKVICDWVSTADTFSTLRELNVNTVYILREVEAPTGYVKASDTEFKLDDYGIVTKISGDAQLVDDQTFNLYNSKQVKEKIVYKTNVTTVKTGDNTNIVIYVILLFVSLLCIFSFLKKKQIKE